MTPGLKCECPNCRAITHVCPAAETLEAEVAQRLTAERERDEAHTDYALLTDHYKELILDVDAARGERDAARALLRECFRWFDEGPDADRPDDLCARIKALLGEDVRVSR